MKSVLFPVATAALAAARWSIAHQQSLAVQTWRSSKFEPSRFGPLAGRSFGNVGAPVLFLHGLGATSEFWSGTYDGLGANHWILAPDLLGFGGSLDEQRTQFGLADQIEALDEFVQATGTPIDGMTIVAHSMGCGLAIGFALANLGRVSKVVLIGAPIYTDQRSAQHALQSMTPMARLLLFDPTIARRACAISCRHRKAAGLLAALVQPQLPISMSRRSSLHTWPAYSQSVTELALGYDWKGQVGRLCSSRTGVEFIWGADDDIGDRVMARAVAGSKSVRVVEGHDHHLPVTAPDLVMAMVDRANTPD